MIPTPNGRLAAVYHAPQGKAVKASRRAGCLILVGGPQYRVGAHRQYIDLARDLAGKGVGVLRFDYLGMGDSEGKLQPLEDRGDDIAAAAQALVDRLGADAKIFPWGLCEGASAIFMHHERIPNLSGAIIANPWVGDPQIEAQVRWRHYYLGRMNMRYMMRRLRDRQLLGQDFLENARGFFRGAAVDEHAQYSEGLNQLPEDMRRLFKRNMPVLYLASSDDRERETFDFALNSSEKWSGVGKSPLLIKREIEGADHTFSNSATKAQVDAYTFEFIDQQTRPLRELAPASAA